MATPAPAEKAFKLYNDLLSVPVNEAPETAEQLLWQLRSLCKATPGNFPALVALIQGALMTGQRDEAAENLERAWGLCQGQPPQVLETFAIQLKDIGQYDRAKTILGEFLSRPALRSSEKFLNHAIQCAVPSGDAEWWRELMEVFRDHGGMADYEIWKRTVSDFDLTRHLPDHFKIVRRFVAAGQCAVKLYHSRVPSGYLCSDVQYYLPLDYLPLDRNERVGLEIQIDRALCDHYEKQDIEPAWYVDVINVSITDSYPQMHAPLPAS